MSKAKRTKSPNTDLVEAARSHRDQILMFHDHRGGTQPVILLDFQRLKLRSYSLKEYKATVRVESQAMLDEEYEKAVAKNKVLVVVWDSATRRLATIKLRRESELYLEPHSAGSPIMRRSAAISATFAPVGRRGWLTARARPDSRRVCPDGRVRCGTSKQGWGIRRQAG